MQSPQNGLDAEISNVSGLRQSREPSISQYGSKPACGHNAVRPGVTFNLKNPPPSGTHVIEHAPLEEELEDEEVEEVEDVEEVVEDPPLEDEELDEEEVEEVEEVVEDPPLEEELDEDVEEVEEVVEDPPLEEELDEDVEEVEEVVEDPPLLEEDELEEALQIGGTQVISALSQHSLVEHFWLGWAGGHEGVAPLEHVRQPLPPVVEDEEVEEVEDVEEVVEEPPLEEEELDDDELLKKKHDPATN